MEEWKQSLLSCTGKFVLIKNESDIQSKDIILREELSQKFTSLVRTAYQRIYDIILFKERQESLHGGSLNFEQVATKK